MVPASGQFVFSSSYSPGAPVTLGINDGVDPIFPTPVTGNLNIPGDVLAPRLMGCVGPATPFHGSTKALAPA